MTQTRPMALAARADLAAAPLPQCAQVLASRRLHTLSMAAALLCLVGANAAVQAQAQTQPQTLPGGMPLLPTADPCSSCAAPVAQASTPPPPQSLPAIPAAPVASAASAESVARFRLNDLRLNGAEALSGEDLRAITAPYIGRDVSLADLESLAQAITQRYRDRGYFLAQALVPVQTVRDGIVELSVIEGRIGKVDVIVAPEAPISEARVRGFLAPVAVGHAVNAQAYERAMLLLSDQPGLRVSSAISEGAVPGSTDLAVEVNPAPRWQLGLEADNHGTREAGRYRAGATLRLNSPLGIGDNLDLRALLSNGNAMQFGRLAYELPLGTAGWRLGAGVSRVNYELGGEFELLGAQGTADVADVSLSYALIRQRGHNLLLRLYADNKRLTDSFEAFHYEGRKRVQGAGLGWAWERRDTLLGGGYWATSGQLYRGQLRLNDVDARQADQAFGGLATEGDFSKLSVRLSRLQALMPRHSLFLSVGGQWASKNLDASEKLALGGATAVRAYPAGEALVDQGWIGSAEWRWAVSDEFTPFVFVDAARGRYFQREPWLYGGESHRSLRGAGIGLNWVRAGSFTLNTTLAWRAGTERARTDGGSGGPRLLVNFQKSF